MRMPGCQRPLRKIGVGIWVGMPGCQRPRAEKNWDWDLGGSLVRLSIEHSSNTHIGLIKSSFSSSLSVTNDTVVLRQRSVGQKASSAYQKWSVRWFFDAPAL